MQYYCIIGSCYYLLEIIFKISETKYKNKNKVASITNITLKEKARKNPWPKEEKRNNFTKNIYLKHLKVTFNRLSFRLFVINPFFLGTE